MWISLIEVPYDCGRLGERMGRGPLALAETLPEALAAEGHDVELRPVRLPDGFFAEVAAVIALQPEVRREVAAASAAGRLPVVLSGNCGVAALGTVAALGPGTGVLWLDAHADFNVPETSPSGFFDGMSMAAMVGRGWAAVRESFIGFTPIAEEQVVLLGARDLDEAEREALAASPVTWIPAAEARRDPARVPAALAALAQRARQLYVHLDLDVLDPAELRANRYAVEGGLGVAEVVATIRAAGERLPLGAVAITAYDPQVDVERRGPEVAAELIAAAAEAARRG
ncbi:MAG TPA: arginase family protein [Thermoanaerobaculia bacterium]|nr:arginase family protein [Thermoanaerobaculia bacterium]